MKRGRARAGVIIALHLFFILIPVSRGYCGDLVATVSEFTGEVLVMKEGAEGFVAIEGRNITLEAGDTLRTLGGAYARLIFESGVEMKVMPFTELTFISNGIKMRIGTGWVTFKRSRNEKGIIFESITPTATVGIKGTTFGVRVDERGATEVVVEEGTVFVADGKKEFVIGSGDAVLVEGPEGETSLRKAKPMEFTLPEPSRIESSAGDSVWSTGEGIQSPFNRKNIQNAPPLPDPSVGTTVRGSH